MKSTKFLPRLTIIEGLIGIAMSFGLVSWAVAYQQESYQDFLSKREAQPVLRLVVKFNGLQLPADVKRFECDNQLTTSLSRFRCTTDLGNGPEIESHFEVQSKDVYAYGFSVAPNSKGELEVMANVDKNAMSPELARDILVQAFERQTALKQMRDAAARALPKKQKADKKTP